ncbi:unnamed protein product [Oncorhynchus mykiss]|uniref:Uncharacterized protein n=1 Tax=Oncorhynchus mykiss TaxID=8022 RepID=A0A060W5T6_ONCMY|nr:unnamed protein product [Oncorhynchus mykiss]
MAARPQSYDSNSSDTENWERKTTDLANSASTRALSRVHLDWRQTW